MTHVEGKPEARGTAFGYQQSYSAPRWLEMERKATRPNACYRPIIHTDCDNMGLRDLLRLPRKGRRARSEARSEAEATNAPSEANLAVPRPTEPNPNLRIDTLTLPLSSPLAPRDQESGGMRMVLSRAIHLTILSHNIGHDPTRPVFSESHSGSTIKLAINMVKESSDVFPPLKSVVGCLSAILEYCDVRSTFFIPSQP
jgi:hypothetical protein